MVDRDINNPEADNSADGDSAVGDEFRLEPIVEKGEALKLILHSVESPARESGGRAAAARYRRNPHTSLYATDSPISRTSAPREFPNIHERGNESLVVPPSKRDYTTIRSLQKYVRWFGYATLVLGPLFLLLRLVHLVFYSTDDLGAKFPAFFSYAFWLTASSAFISATFLASSEFFQLVIDIQSNTFTKSQPPPRDN